MTTRFMQMLCIATVACWFAVPLAGAQTRDPAQFDPSVLSALGRDLGLTAQQTLMRVAANAMRPRAI